jgi:hypothetical protein
MCMEIKLLHHPVVRDENELWWVFCFFFSGKHSFESFENFV